MEIKDVVIPTFRDKEYNIMDFGAVEGGFISNSDAINKAIIHANAEGGGKVIIPRGIWLTGPIKLLSNINLFLDKGSYVVFTKSKEDYPIIMADYEGQARLRATSPISAYEATNVAITGLGIINGSGDLWRPIKSWKVTAKHWDNLLKINDKCIFTTKECDIWCPTETYYEGCLIGEPDLNCSDAIEKATKHYDFYRPVLLSLVKCENILLEGVTFSNSPAWNIHPLFCKNLTVRNIRVENPEYAQNGDGIDVESCKNVHIHDSFFAVGDDGICIKSGKNRLAREIKIPTENVYVHDCTVYHAHGGIVFGSEMSRGIKNVVVKDCNFIGTDIGIRFKSAIGRGGVVEDILIENIRMTDIKNEAITFNLGYVLYTIEHEKEDKVKTTDIADVPEFKNIKIKNVVCNKAKTAIMINGLDEIPVHDIMLENVVIEAKNGYSIKRAKNIIFNKVTFISVNDPTNRLEIDYKTINENEEFHF